MINYKYTLICITDSGTVAEKVWVRDYENAIEAVNQYNSFNDHGMCVLERVVTLTEPSGLTHSKVLKYPYASEKEYEEACARWRTKTQLSQVK